jgi:hypothetical protein
MRTAPLPINRLSLCNSAKRSGLFIGSNKLALVSPSDDDQETDPHANRNGGETAGACDPADSTFDHSTKTRRRASPQNVIKTERKARPQILTAQIGGVVQ